MRHFVPTNSKKRRGWHFGPNRSSTNETGVTSVADPLGGSIYIEELTDQIEQGARDYIQRIDAMGGTLAAIEKGFIQAEIQNAAYAFQQSVERGETVVVAVNRFRQVGRKSSHHVSDGPGAGAATSHPASRTSRVAGSDHNGRAA